MNDPNAADQKCVHTERVVLCKSQPRGNKEQAIVSNAERRCLDALKKLASRVEDGFKALKSDLGLRPNRHQTEERVDAHVFISVPAYHLLRNILWTLEQKGDNRNWETLKGVLCTHCYTTILLPTRSGQTHRIRRAGQPEECQKGIYRHLGIAWDKLPRTRTIIGTVTTSNEDHARQSTL
ncbi:MAG: hypothetical protein H7831_12405 [Magnetococcus sp. WYHC-3]